MADTYELTGTIKGVVDLKLAVTADSGAVSSYKSDTANLRHIGAIANGKGDNKAEDFYEVTMALGAGATVTIDLVSTTVNRYGLALAWDLLKGIFIFAPATNPDTVTIGGGANPVFATFEPLPPGCSALFQWPLIATSPVVAAGASDQINCTNDDGGVAAVLYIACWGEKA